MESAAHGKFSGRSVLVLGCGYVGTAVVDALSAEGATVTALTRNPETAAVLRQRGATTIVADAAETDWHGRIRQPVDLVLNCLSGGGGALEDYRRSYLGGMASWTQWARAAGFAGTFVYTSSTSVYPQGGGVTVDESAPVGGEERADILVEAERMVTASKNPGYRWFVLRLAGIYGPGRHYLIEQIRSGLVAGKGDYHLNLIHRDDIVGAILAGFGAAASVGNDVLNLADDGAATKEEIVGWLAARLGLSVPPFTAEAAPRRRAVTPDRIIANARIKQRLGWRPRYPSFREGYDAILAPPLR